MVTPAALILALAVGQGDFPVCNFDGCQTAVGLMCRDPLALTLRNLSTTAIGGGLYALTVAPVLPPGVPLKVEIWDGTDTAAVTAANALVVDGSAVTQPVSDAGASLTVDGTVTANQGAAALPAGAWPMEITDGVDTAGVTAANALQVDGSGVTQPVSDGGGILTVDGTVTANQGAAAAVAGGWPVKVTDGINTLALVENGSVVGVADWGTIPFGLCSIGGADTWKPLPLIANTCDSLVISGTVNQGNPGPGDSPWPVELVDAAGDAALVSTAGSVATEPIPKVGTPTSQENKNADTDMLAATANARLIAATCADAAGTAATWRVALRAAVLSGGNCTGTAVAFFRGTTGGTSAFANFGPTGANVAAGVCMDVLAGAVDCAITYVVLAAP